MQKRIGKMSTQGLTCVIGTFLLRTILSIPPHQVDLWGVDGSRGARVECQSLNLQPLVCTQLVRGRVNRDRSAELSIHVVVADERPKHYIVKVITTNWKRQHEKHDGNELVLNEPYTPSTSKGA